MRTEQRKEYGVDSRNRPWGGPCSRRRKDMVQVEKIVRVLVPSSLRASMLQQAHGERTGNWGVLRTAAKVRSRYYWPGWLCDVKKCVQQCFACSMDKLKRPGKQAKMVQHHPQRRFQVVGIDVMEMSPTSRLILPIFCGSGGCRRNCENCCGSTIRALGSHLSAARSSSV
jgi:Integrase zinc binding domain